MNNADLPRRTKIICTLGPRSNTYEKIRRLAESGMNAARLNFSHGTHEEYRTMIDDIRQVSDDVGKPIAILQDLQGPKIRVQTFEKGAITLSDGDDFVLTVRRVVGNEKEVSVSYASFNRDVREGDAVLLDDGNIRLTVTKIEGPDVWCTVVYGGVLSDFKGINLPGSVLSVEAMTEKDRQDLEFGLDRDVDFVALSFVQKPEDVVELKNLIAARGKNTRVVAKIEKPQAVDNIDAITDVTDYVMIARGDLGVEMLTEEVPPIQKGIIKLCNTKGIPVITATQMLESMITSARPTRAEAADVANAVLDGSDAVMLSGETATGAFPVEAVSTMARIISLIEDKSDVTWSRRRRRPDMQFSVSQAIGYSACQAADMVKAAAIVCLTQSGSTAAMIARFRPGTPIVAVTPKKPAYCRTSLMWGVAGYLVDEFHEDMDSALREVITMLERKKMITPGDTLVFTAGIPFSQNCGTNMLRIEKA